MAIIDESNISIDVLPGYDGRISVLRLDKVHPVISGNKWYKLRYNIDAAKAQGCDGVTTFGGPHSNHLIATAAAAADAGLESVGIVRSRGWVNDKTTTLQQCEAYGMALIFVNKEAYDINADDSLTRNLQQNTEAYIIPEGGANAEGRRGAGEIMSLIPEGYRHICVSVGSGTTLAGMAAALPAGVQLHGYAPMKGGVYLTDEVKPFIPQDAQWNITDAYHFGGFGKCTDELIAFMNDMYSQHGLPLDVVYTAKMLYGVLEDLEAGKFGNDERVLCIHTGGLQGNAAIYHRLLF